MVRVRGTLNETLESKHFWVNFGIIYSYTVINILCYIIVGQPWICAKKNFTKILEKKCQKYVYNCNY